MGATILLGAWRGLVSEVLALAAWYDGRASGAASPLLGKKLCEANAACPDVFGVAGFKIVEE